MHNDSLNFLKTMDINCNFYSFITNTVSSQSIISVFIMTTCVTYPFENVRGPGMVHYRKLVAQGAELLVSHNNFILATLNLFFRGECQVNLT